MKTNESFGADSPRPAFALGVLFVNLHTLCPSNYIFPWKSDN